MDKVMAVFQTMVDDVGGMTNFVIILVIFIVLINFMKICFFVIDIMKHIRWRWSVRFRGGIVVASDPFCDEKVAWLRIWREIHSKEAEGFKMVDMAMYYCPDGCVYEALLECEEKRKERAKWN